MAGTSVEFDHASGIYALRVCFGVGLTALQASPTLPGIECLQQDFDPLLYASIIFDTALHLIAHGSL